MSHLSDFLRTLPTWSPAGPLTHIGTLVAADKGIYGDSQEGHGLSVSECPKAWEQIARLGDNPWWQVDRLDGKPLQFLHWRGLTAEQRAELARQAENHGFLVRSETYRLWERDTETGQRCFVEVEHYKEACDALDAAQEDFDGKPEDEPVLEPVNGHRLSVHAMNLLKREKATAYESVELATLLLVELAADHLDGMYWADKMAPAAHVAPRAVILPSRLDRIAPTAANDVARLGCSAEFVAAREEWRLKFYENEIITAIDGAKPAQLRAALAVYPKHPCLSRRNDGHQGTPHQHALHHALLLTCSLDMPGVEVQVAQLCECALALAEQDAPCHYDDDISRNVGPAGEFFAYAWAGMTAANVIDDLFQQYLIRGMIDPNWVVTNVSPQLNGLHVFTAALTAGNSKIATRLIEAGADLQSVCEMSGCRDIIEHASGFEHAGPVVSILAQRAMHETMQAPRRDVAAHAPQQRRGAV